MVRKRSWIVKRTNISSQQQLTVRNGRGKGLCWRRVRRRRQNGTNRKRTWKLRTSSLVIKVEEIGRGLRWIKRRWRIRNWGGIHRLSWKRREHFWCACNMQLLRWDTTLSVMLSLMPCALIIAFLETFVASHRKIAYYHAMVSIGRALFFRWRQSMQV